MSDYGIQNRLGCFVLNQRDGSVSGIFYVLLDALGCLEVNVRVIVLDSLEPHVGCDDGRRGHSAQHLQDLEPLCAVGDLAARKESGDEREVGFLHRPQRLGSAEPRRAATAAGASHEFHDAGESNDVADFCIEDTETAAVLSYYLTAENLVYDSEGQAMYFSTNFEPYKIQMQPISALPRTCDLDLASDPVTVFESFASYMETHYAFFDLYGVYGRPKWAEQLNAFILRKAKKRFRDK